MNLAVVVLVLLVAGGAPDKYGHLRRGPTARHEFRMSHPCPGTGLRKGACPGYVVDHVIALECGGADDAANMQWQTVAEGRKKDKLERFCRTGH